jgi:hypothetical protein
MVALPTAADFGPLVVASDINDCVIAALRYWLPTHIAQVERERADVEAAVLARPLAESYATVQVEAWPDHRLPAIIVDTAGTIGTPDKDGDGFYYADWDVTVTALVRGRNMPETRWLASIYEGCVRRAMLMQDSRQAGRVRWVGTDPVRPVFDEDDQGRYMAAAVGRYVCEVERVAQDGAGPLLSEPDDLTDPYERPDPSGNPDDEYGPLLPVERVLIDTRSEPT